MFSVLSKPMKKSSWERMIHVASISCTRTLSHAILEQHQATRAHECEKKVSAYVAAYLTCILNYRIVIP